ncbi:transposase [Megasphaera sp.]|uniref:transposase n=1 Tax=Megasphaera sp. TaxID=2023260 RepID=UPI003F7FA657
MPLTSENRKACFVIDDSLYERAGYKRTELAARVFDHVSMRYKKGFRLLTLGWTDGEPPCPSTQSFFLRQRIRTSLARNLPSTIGHSRTIDKR